MKSYYALGKFALLLFSLIVSTASLSLAQTTEFIFQAKLPNSITPATDIYEMEFKLFDSMSDGNQIASAVIVSNVDVKNRGYAVKLDFGAAAFPGADRFLEVSVLVFDSVPWTRTAISLGSRSRLCNTSRLIP